MNATSQFFIIVRTKRRHNAKNGMLNVSQKVPQPNRGLCATCQHTFKWRRTVRQTMLLAWNTIPDDNGWEQPPATTKRAGKPCCDKGRANPCNHCRDNSVRQQCKLKMQLTKEDFTTSRWVNASTRPWEPSPGRWRWQAVCQHGRGRSHALVTQPREEVPTSGGRVPAQSARTTVRCPGVGEVGS